MDRLSLTLFHDPLSPYSAVAATRITTLLRELGAPAVLSYKACPLRSPRRAGVDRTEPGDTERRLLPLLGAEAAALDGLTVQERFLESLRHAAFQGGLDITCRALLLEAASRAGVRIGRFAAALDSPLLRAAVLRAREEALARGVWAIPSLVFDDRWLLTGLRAREEYREVLLGRLGRSMLRPVPIVH